VRVCILSCNDPELTECQADENACQERQERQASFGMLTRIGRCSDRPTLP
jgi:hypothetical protein